MEYLNHSGRIVRIPEINHLAVMSAYASKPVKLTVRNKARKEAVSPEPCVRCGIPGTKGCNHQLPYQAAPVLKYRNEHGNRHG